MKGLLLILLLRQVRLENVCMLLGRTLLTMPEKVGMTRRETVVSQQVGLPGPTHTSGPELEEARDPRPPGPRLSSQPTLPHCSPKGTGSKQLESPHPVLS